MRFNCLPLRSLVILILTLSCPILALSAPAPRETIDRLAQIAVEKAETRHLNAMGKLTDKEYYARTKTLDAEQTTLWQPYRLMTNTPPDEAAEIKAATSTITGLSRAKLSLLEPKWTKEEQAYREAQGNRRQEIMRDADRSAKQAAQIQKQRLGLQAQLDKGTLDRTTFDQKDKEALAAIESLRNKNDPQGRPGYYFDERLTYYTSLPEKAPTPAVVKKPPPPAVVYRPPPEPPAGYSTWYWIGGGLFDTLSAMSWGEIAVWVIGIWLFLGFLVAVFFPDKQQQPQAPKTSGIHGTARWAKYEERAARPKYVETGVFFGKSSRPSNPANAPGAPIASVPESHTLIVARTRAGKGTRVIVPTLLRYRYSMLVIDPKGENAAITARTRRDQLKQSVHIINPWGEMKDLYSNLGFETATFNPLDAIERDDPNAVAVAQTLAATMCPVKEERDRFWQGSAANVLAGVLLWISDQPGEEKTLARAREIITQSRGDFKKNTLTKMMASTAFSGAIKEMVSQYYDLADDTYSGIMSNLAESTKFLSDPQIKASTASSSFSMEKIRDKYMTVFIVIPHDRIQTHATWLRLVIAAAMQAIKNRSRIRTPAHHRCMFLIDEFGSIGHIADVPRDIAIMSGYGLDLTLIIQGLDQLKHHYGEAKNTILSNCGYKWFCYVGDLDTAKYLSETLGKKTVQTVGTSTSQGTNKGGETEGSSTTYGETGRDLLTPDEVLNLGKDVAILLNPITSPGYLRTIDYWRLREEFSDVYPSLTYDDNPYRNPTRLISPKQETPDQMLQKLLDASKHQE